MKLPNWIKLTPTIDTNVYAANDLVGPRLEFDLSAFADVDELYLNHVLLMDKADQAGGYTLVLFEEDPTNTTFTDNGALDINDGDADKIIGVIALTVQTDVGGLRVNYQTITNTMRFPIPIRNAGASKLYGCLMLTSGTPTFAANSLVVKLGFETVRR
jgi:hypothetical protein